MLLLSKLIERTMEGMGLLMHLSHELVYRHRVDLEVYLNRTLLVEIIVKSKFIRYVL